jgi:hypothetical protein
MLLLLLLIQRSWVLLAGCSCLNTACMAEWILLLLRRRRQGSIQQAGR